MTTDYIEISDARVQPKAPMTSELVTALRDNPKAIAEGHEDAPRVTSGGLGLDRIIAGTLDETTSEDIVVGSTVELGSSSNCLVFVVGTVTIEQIGGGHSELKLQGSLDGETWDNTKTIVSNEGAVDSTATLTNSFFLSSNYKFWRLYLDVQASCNITTTNFNLVFMGVDS